MIQLLMIAALTENFDGPARWIGGAMAANGSSQHVSFGTPSALQDLVRGNATFETWVNTSSGGTLLRETIATAVKAGRLE
jgi:hypothetical protein